MVALAAEVSARSRSCCKELADIGQCRFDAAVDARRKQDGAVEIA